MRDSFEDLLDKPLDNFKKPPAMPEGNYIFQVTDFKFGKTTGEKKTNFVEFETTYVEAMPDVDADNLSTVLDGNALTSKKSKLTFYLTADAMWRLSQFLHEHLGLPIASVRDAIQAAKGNQFLGNVKQEISQRNPQDVYSNIASTAKVPEVG